MADTTTTNYGLTKPEVGASENTWGAKLNVNMNLIDTQMKVSDTRSSANLPKAGGTMTGALVMGANNITTTGKIYYANMFSQLSDLPSASTYHGMFAHVHATGKGYYAHAGAWVELANQTDLTTATNTANAALPKAGGALSGDVTNTSTGSLQVSQGTTAQRPSGTTLGRLRYNSTTSGFEGYTAAGWGEIGGGGSSLGTDSIIRTNAKVIAENITFAGNENGSTVGPVTVNNNYTVTVTNGSTWIILQETTMPITIKNSAGGGVTLDSTTSNNETVNLPTGGGTLVGTATPSFTGNATITSGNLVIATAGKGLAVGGTGAANTLDDYEEGTWTPVIVGGSLSRSIEAATYTKIGNIVQLQAYLTLADNGNATSLSISGMPFTNIGGNGYSVGLATHAGGSDLTSTKFARADNNSATLVFYKNASGTVTQAMVDASFFIFSITYRTA